MPIMYGLVRGCTYLGQPVTLVDQYCLKLSNLLEAGTNSNAISIVSKEAYSLSRIIKLGPTHMSETRR